MEFKHLSEENKRLVQLEAGLAPDYVMEAASRSLCPWFTGDGICNQGCYSEPACETDQPEGGWDGVIKAWLRGENDEEQ